MLISFLAFLFDPYLIVQQRFQTTLCNFRLIWCVLSRPAGVLEDVPQNRVWHVAVVVAHSDVRPPNLIFLRNVPNPIDESVFICDGNQNIILTGLANAGLAVLSHASLGVHMGAKQWLIIRGQRLSE